MSITKLLGGVKSKPGQYLFKEKLDYEVFTTYSHTFNKGTHIQVLRHSFSLPSLPLSLLFILILTDALFGWRWLKISILKSVTSLCSQANCLFW